MKHLGIMAIALGALLTFTGCGGESGGEGADGSASEASGEAGFPEMTEGKGPGRISGTIGGHSLDVEGVCSPSPGSFGFWTDGTDFASNSDATGDGQYLTLNVYNTGDRVMTALRYSKDDETVYNGSVAIDSFDGKTLTVDSMLGRAQEIAADFTITCE